MSLACAARTLAAIDGDALFDGASPRAAASPEPTVSATSSPPLAAVSAPAPTAATSARASAAEAIPPPAAAVAAADSSDGFVSQILSLGWKQPLPMNLFGSYSVSDIAASLVERLTVKEAKDGPGASFPGRAKAAPPAGAEMVDMMSDTELHRFAWSSHLFAFADHGLLNQFQTHTTNGSDDLDARNAVEQMLMAVGFGKDYSNQDVNELRPKYGIVFFKAFPSTANRSYDYIYGDFVFVLKDSVKERATWTQGDSLDRVYCYKAPYDSGNVFKLKIPRADVHLVSKRGGQAFEFQAWGPIGMEDVEAIGVFPNTPAIFKEAVVDAGFKVEEFETYPDGGHSGYRFKDVLAPGDPRKEADWLRHCRARDLDFIEEAKRFPGLGADLRPALEGVLPQLRSADDFLRLVDPGSGPADSPTRQALSAFAKNHEAAFKALSPTREQEAAYEEFLGGPGLRGFLVRHFR